MSFVAALNDGDRAAGCSRQFWGVGQALSLAVVAEGIEEQSQIATLEAIGCKMGQGFLLAKPGAAEAIESLLDPDAPARAVGSSV